MEEVDNRTRDKGFYPNGPSGVMNLSAVEPFSEKIMLLHAS